MVFSHTKGDSEAVAEPIPDETSDMSEVDFHKGEALLSLCRHYPSLLKTLLEMIQNGIDNEAKVIFVGIDLDARQVVVADNGVGTTKARFEEALLSVAKSVKRPGKLGRFGMGLVSPIDKCETYTFSSAPVGQSGGLTWTFREAEIRKQHHKLEIPCKRIANLPKVGSKFTAQLKGAFNARFRTVVKLTKVTRDRQISLVDLETLGSEVRQNFGAAMLRLGVQVRVALIKDGNMEVCDIDPQPFQGDPFDIVSYTDAHAGSVQIELYRASRQRGKREGKVSVMMLGDDFGVPMSTFANQARAGTLWEFVETAVSVLSSGFFEGCIKCENIELNADRGSFAYNDALHGLYEVLNTWYEEHGQSLFEAEREENDRDRYELLGSQSLERLRELLADTLWKRFGNSSPNPEGDEATPGTADGDTGTKPGTRGGGDSDRDPGPGGDTKQPNKPAKPKQGGPGDEGGNKKATVRGSAQGLSFSYDELPGSTRLWQFDFTTGTLILNIRHPIWVKLDETKGRHTARNDKWIMHLQEWLALELLNLLVTYASHDELEANRELIDRRIEPYVEMFVVTRR